MRRSLLSAAAIGLASRWARADEVFVPIGLQASLLAKVAGYDRNFAARAGDAARVLIVRKGGAESVRTAGQLEQAVGALDDIAGLPPRVTVAAFSDAAALAAQCSEQRAAVVWLAAGFQGDIPAIAAALAGANILSVTVANEVAGGVVLGFDLVSGKPKLLCNITQARKQNVSFKADILKLMRVVE